MNFRWYISTLIIILTFLGVVNQQYVSEPNQEIVVQFTNTDVSSDDAQITITNVKEHLENLGANNIQVTEGEEKGELIISYYSDVDVANIKKTLSDQKDLELNASNENESDSKIPFDEKSSHYNIDIYEIQKDNGSDWDLNGTYVAELKPDGNRFSNPDVYAFLDDIEVRGITEKVAYTVHYNIALSINNTLYKIPEVRAGPLA